ncbi:MAG: hypothetical protein Q3993_08935, partial [Filifactor alocis]|nr:hypothetical protein [Filifactor alocis]
QMISGPICRAVIKPNTKPTNLANNQNGEMSDISLSNELFSIQSGLDTLYIIAKKQDKQITIITRM